MTSTAVKDRLNERPFRSFGMRMPDGRLLPIPHPEFISIEPEEERTAIVWKGNGGYWTVDLQLVSDLEPLKTIAGKEGISSSLSIRRDRDQRSRLQPHC